MTTATLKKTERIDARVTPEEKSTLETAARLKGTSLRDFVILSAKKEALRTIRELEKLTLAERSRKVFVETLMNPPKPTAKALAAAKRFKQEIA